MVKTGLFEPINLDGLSVDPADLDEAARTFEMLMRYARRKSDAMRHRLAGNVSVALILESDCDRIHALLPTWARW